MKGVSGLILSDGTHQVVHRRLMHTRGILIMTPEGATDFRVRVNDVKPSGWDKVRDFLYELGEIPSGGG